VNPSTAAVARSAAVAIVLILAAALGLVAGSVLDARDGGAIDPGARGPSVPHMSGFDGARDSALQNAGTGAPAYAAVFPNVWGNIEQADPVTSESWGNIEGTSARESLTAPTPR
jgi:hypothetical protein